MRKIVSEINLDLVREMCSELDDGVVLIDKHLNIVWVNEHLEKKGFLINNIKGLNFIRVFNNREDIVDEYATLNAIAHGKIYKSVRKGNDNHMYKVISIPLFDDYEVQYVLEVSEDLGLINDELKKEKKLEIIEVKKEEKKKERKIKKVKIIKKKKIKKKKIKRIKKIKKKAKSRIKKHKNKKTNKRKSKHKVYK